MIILNIILGVALFSAIIVIIALWQLTTKYLEIAMNKNPKPFIKDYFKEQTQEEFPCTLMLTIQNGADFEGSIYDFSLYEDKKIIGLIECRKEKLTDKDIEDPIILPNQTVCLMKDGGYQWRFFGDP